MLWPTATAAFLAPRLADSRRYWGGQICLLVARRGMCSLDQRGAQPGAALARLAAALLASAFVVARAHPRPGHQMVSRREASHVSADLGKQHFGDNAPG